MSEHPRELKPVVVPGLTYRILRCLSASNGVLNAEHQPTTLQ